MNFLSVVGVIFIGFLASLATRNIVPDNSSDIEFAFVNGVVLMMMLFLGNWVVSVLASERKKK